MLNTETISRILARNKFFLIYLLKFIGIFCIVYFGTKAMIGLAVPGRFYSSFIDHYLDYISWLRASLLHACKFFLGLFGYYVYLTDQHQIRLIGGEFGVRIVYSCLGYGMMSFWIALICANRGGAVKKTLWIIGGLFCIWIINVTRISMLLVAANNHQKMPLGIDHHTWFNIASYILIFILIYFFDKSQKGRPIKPELHPGDQIAKKQWT